MHVVQCIPIRKCVFKLCLCTVFMAFVYLILFIFISGFVYTFSRLGLPFDDLNFKTCDYFTNSSMVNWAIQIRPL